MTFVVNKLECRSGLVHHHKVASETNTAAAVISNGSGCKDEPRLLLVASPVALAVVVSVPEVGVEAPDEVLLALVRVEVELEELVLLAARGLLWKARIILLACSAMP